jgi:hypothetical protein
VGSSSGRPHGLREVVPAREPGFHNVLELWAVERALLHVAFQNLLVLSDNSIVVSHITKEGGTRSFTLYRERSS